MSARTRRVALSVLCVVAAWGLNVRAEGEWGVPKDPAKFHIFLFMGQSNMAGGFRDSHLYDDAGNYDPVTKPVPRVLQRRGRAWQPAAHPLTKHNKASFSIPLPFAEKYLEEIGDPEVKVGLFILAFGGKAIDHFIEGGRYHPSGAALRALKDEGVFKGIIWHQGEADSTRVLRFVTYEKKLHGLIADIRADLDLPDLPFVTGQLSRQASNRDPEKEYWAESLGVVTRVLANVGDRVHRAAHVRSAGAAVCTEHVRQLVDEDGKPTGKTRRMRADPIHFNRSGYTTLAHRYLDAILDRPTFKNDPVRITTVPGRTIAASLVGEVSDVSKDALKFAASGVPDWLTIASNGTVSGTAPALGTHACAITVTDRSGAVDTSQLLIVAREAGPPSFSADAFERSPAIVGREFRDRVRYDYVRAWSSEVFEPNGDALAFSKVSGPAWLEVSSDGSFSGTPGPDDVGKACAWKVKVSDGDGSATATYSVEVLPGRTVWVESFDYYPDIRQEAMGPVARLDASTPRDTWLIQRGGFPVNEGKAYTDLRTSLYGQWHKFAKGTVCARAIALSEKRFSRGKGRYRFRFELFGLSADDVHLFVSIYDVQLGSATGAACAIELESRKVRGLPAKVAAEGGAAVEKVAEMDCRRADGAGVKDLEFDYDGAGDVLLVFTATRDANERGGGTAFDDLSVVAVESAP